jgi:hypothetical protein
VSFPETFIDYMLLFKWLQYKFVLLGGYILAHQGCDIQEAICRQLIIPVYLPLVDCTV